MFQTPEALDKDRHAALRYAPAADYGFARSLLSAPVAAIEVPEAAAFYPVLFPVEGAVPAVVLGLTDTNVYVDGQGRWNAPYVPAHIRRYPFILADGPEAGRFLVAVDTAAPHFKSGQGEPLFTEAGEPGPAAKGAIDFLSAFQRSIEQTKALLGELDGKGVLIEKPINIQDGRTARAIGGFRVVDEEKLKALDDATLAKWARSGVLQVVHAHWSSLRHLNAVAVASKPPAA